MNRIKIAICLIVLAVVGTMFWHSVPKDTPLRICVETDVADVHTLASTSHPVYIYDYCFIPQNRTPEIVVTLR